MMQLIRRNKDYIFINIIMDVADADAVLLLLFADRQMTKLSGSFILFGNGGHDGLTNAVTYLCAFYNLYSKYD